MVPNLWAVLAEYLRGKWRDAHEVRCLRRWHNVPDAHQGALWLVVRVVVTH